MGEGRKGRPRRVTLSGAARANAHLCERPSFACIPQEARYRAVVGEPNWNLQLRNSYGVGKVLSALQVW